MVIVMNKIFLILIFFSLYNFGYTNKKMEQEANNMFIPIYKQAETRNGNIINKLSTTNEIYKLKNKDATDLIAILSGINGVKVKGIDNFLILSGSISDVNDIKKLIEKIDVKKRQVLLKLNVIDTSKNLFDRLGFNWRFNNKGSFTGLLSEFISGNISFTNLLLNSSKLFDINIYALKEKGEIVLKSSPNMVVLDGSKGIFKITDENIFEVNKNSKNKAIFSKEAGIILEVNPKIYSIDDVEYVQLKLKAEVSNFQNRTTKKQNVIETVVNVGNKKNMFIGGSTSILQDNNKSKTPILSDIPLIGSLFTYRNKSNVQRGIYMEIEVGIL